VQGLRTPTRGPNDLTAAVGTLVEELAADPTVCQAPSLRVGVAGAARLQYPVIRDEIYRIAAEAVRNALQHWQAMQVEVELRYDEHPFRLRVLDDGKGSDELVLAEGGRAAHCGLRGVREWAEFIGAKLTRWSARDSCMEVEHIAATRAHAKARAPGRELA